MAKLTGLLGSALFDSLHNFANRIAARFGAEVAFAVDADTDGVGIHVALPDDEHGVNVHLLGALDFPGM